MVTFGIILIFIENRRFLKQLQLFYICWARIYFKVFLEYYYTGIFPKFLKTKMKQWCYPFMHEFFTLPLFLRSLRFSVFLFVFSVFSVLLGGVEMPSLCFLVSPSLFGIVLALLFWCDFLYFWFSDKWGGKASAIKIKRHFGAFWLTDRKFENVGQVSAESDIA